MYLIVPPERFIVALPIITVAFGYEEFCVAYVPLFTFTVAPPSA